MLFLKCEKFQTGSTLPSSVRNGQVRGSENIPDKVRGKTGEGKRKRNLLVAAESPRINKYPSALRNKKKIPNKKV